MTPADIRVEWPTPDEIARAIVAAAKVEVGALADLAPLGVDLSAMAARARIYAALAVAHQFPTAPRDPLSEKFGNRNTLTNFRSNMRHHGHKWFSINRLNLVRAACGWSPMTEQEAIDAPLVYCGRSWMEFVDCPVEEAAPEVEERDTERLTPWSQVLQDVEQQIAEAPRFVRTEPTEPAGAQAVEAPEPVKHAIPAAPTPSPAAYALAEAARAMRRPALSRRVIDRRITGGDVTAALCGDPTPEQRARLAARTDTYGTRGRD